MGPKTGKKEARKAPGSSRIVFVAISLAALAALAYVLSQPPAPQPGAVAEGDVAPDFDLPTVTEDGALSGRVRLSSFKGRVVVLEFMVSWCKFCQAMAPTVQALYEEYGPRGVAFISVAGTFQGATVESTAKFMRDYGAKWVHAMDLDNKVFLLYGVKGTPTFFIVDADGVVRSKREGMMSYETFSFLIEKALQAGRSSLEASLGGAVVALRQYGQRPREKMGYA